MPRLTVRVPMYRLHKPSGRAVVTLNGRDIYLGKHGSPESKAEYNQLVAEWQLSGRSTPPRAAAPDSALTIDEVIAAYMAHVERHYIKNGKPTSSQEEARRALAPLHEQYGTLPTFRFGPLTLKALRQSMVEPGNWCRSTVNKAVGVITRMFKWAAENELVPAEAHQRLRTVSGLRKGRSEARESEPVGPAPEDQIEAVLKHVAKPVAAMIQLQRFTGMRPDEVVSMRLGEIDRSGRVWVYTPASHKTEHHGRIRRIYIGPRAQKVLMPYLRDDPEAYLFCPRDADVEHRERRRLRRRTPLSCGNRRKSHGLASTGRQGTISTNS